MARCAAESVPRTVIGGPTSGVTHVARGRHRLRDELDPPARRRRHDRLRRHPALRDVHRETAGRPARPGRRRHAACSHPEALERTRVALADYTAVLRRKGAERVRMVATSATRDARNRDDFFGMVRATLGVDAEVISGDEEAQLSFVGAVGDLDPDDGPFVVVDVGGGSTELVVGDARRTDGRRCAPPARSTSAASGSPSAACPATRRRADEVAQARELAAGILDDAFAAVPVEGVRTWVGVAGTITTLSAVAQELPEYDPDAVHLSRLSRDRPAPRRRGTARHVPRASAARHGAIHPGRIDVIGGGALIVDVLARRAARARRRSPSWWSASTTSSTASPAPSPDPAPPTSLAQQRRSRTSPARARLPPHLGDDAGVRSVVRVVRRWSVAELDAALVDCRACPRLVAWREQVAREKRAAFRDEEYWGRPVPGFGPGGRAAADRRARARPRTAPTAPAGCSPATAPATCCTPRCTPSGLANQPTAVHSGDGLELHRHPDHRAGALRAAGQQADAGRARHLRRLAARRAGAAARRVRWWCSGAFGWQALLPVLAGAGWAVPRPRPRFGARRARRAGR